MGFAVNDFTLNLSKFGGTDSNELIFDMLDILANFVPRSVQIVLVHAMLFVSMDGSKYGHMESRAFDH